MVNICCVFIFRKCIVFKCIKLPTFLILDAGNFHNNPIEGSGIPQINFMAVVKTEPQNASLRREMCLNTTTSGKGELLHLIKVY